MNSLPRPPAMPGPAATPRLRVPWLTVGLAALNIADFCALAPSDAADVDALVRGGAKVGSLILDLGEVWRLLAANFVHKDARHLALNLLILVPVSAVLENLYRRLDCAALFLGGAIGSMAFSLAFSDGVSVGASGVIYAVLAAVTAFALRYRFELPPPYRRALREAGLPFLLIIVGMGWSSRGIDQAAHIGGFLTGALLSPLLRPRPFGRIHCRSARGPFSILLAVGLSWGVGGGLLQGMLPLWRLERDDDFGIGLPVPRSWRPAANPLGKVAFSNGLPGYGRAAFAAEAITQSESADPFSAAKQFAATALTRAALGPTVRELSVSEPSPVQVGGRGGWRVGAEYEDASGGVALDAYFVPRGELLYQLVFTRPLAFPRYAGVERQMLKRIELDEPRALREARARVLLFPRAPWALGELGEVLRKLGENDLAATALQASIKDEPSAPVLREELAISLLRAGRTEEGCTSARAAVLYAPFRSRAHEVSARCELLRARPQAALNELEEAQRLAPDNQQLGRELDALRRALTGMGSPNPVTPR